MNILVTGGTGNVGALVVRELLGREASVHVLTRSAEKAAALPSGVKGVVGDLKDPQAVRTVFNGMDAVLLINTVSPTENHEGLMAINGIRDAGVPRVVYVSVQNADDAPHLPHFGSKVGVELALKASSLEWTILRPNNFYQNDYWQQVPLLEHGVYTQPIGSKGISRVDVRDIAEAAAITLTSPGHAGNTYNLVGPDVWTGEGTAEAWANALGTPIAYAGDDLDAWEKAQAAFLPDYMVYDFSKMYTYFQTHGLLATSNDVTVQTAVLGHTPRSFVDFTMETAATWRGESNR